MHRLRNLTITAYNRTLSNKSFIGQARAGRLGRPLHRGYRNGLSLNSSLAAKESWPVPDIDARTDELASEVIGRFRCSGSGFPVGRDASFWTRRSLYRVPRDTSHSRNALSSAVVFVDRPPSQLPNTGFTR